MASEEELRPADHSADAVGDSDKKYTVNAMCSNCGERQKVSLPQGTPLAEKPCSNCQVSALKPQWA
jgi:hypothetical protein